jgi:chemotaxis regulatin CheY-phosphate phosphatase CheZ
VDDRPTQLTEDEYEHIEETIARSAKGRAFLRRYARLAQGGAADDVRRLLEQMRAVLSDHQAHSHAAQHVAALRRELLEMAASIEQARREVAALRPQDGDSDKFLSATNELDAIVTSTERASFDILNSAERLMDLSSRLRRGGADAELCSDIEGEVTSIFTACSFQDLTGQRTSKVVSALRYIEQRINAMTAIWDLDGVEPTGEAAADSRPDSHLLNGPSLPGHGIGQSDVDLLFGGAEPSAGLDAWEVLDAAPEPEPTPEPWAEAEPVADPAPDPVPAPRAKRAKAPPKAAAKRAEPAPAPEPAPPPPVSASTPPAASPLDQSAIDALFG